ncbi:beta-1,6-N-acetylglucosaminyltransferase [Roseobacter sp.]|uniref:DUF5927 domain-containing protein n=1 Tax=Roseobacter sp. TaxID=1907202 RepID=UPI003297D24C
MSVGVVMLVHTALVRAEQVVRHWADAGCPVVVHVDKRVPQDTYAAFESALAAVPNVSFCTRYRCEWGTWGIVAATQAAAGHLLAQHPDVGHVYLASGACLPLRPVNELVAYLAARAQTDFIESATTSDVPWTIGGLDAERFTLWFPFSWKRQRFLFDRYVALQQRLGLKRRVPAELRPHMGSQWWCLTRNTLSAILNDPNRARFDRYFKRVWIPDESYFQTLARLHAVRIESRSLTLSKFDFQGKPHIFYDDHLQLLRRSDCFVARKIWPRADGLYDAFLAEPARALAKKEPSPGKIDRIFSKALERRARGRAGLCMQSRFPAKNRDIAPTAAPYSVLHGFSELFEDFEGWLSKTIHGRVHGHLFAPDQAHFADGEAIINGALSNNAVLRDYNPNSFLRNLIWNTRGMRQCFQFGPGDNQAITEMMMRDPNAHICVISGAWAVPLFRSNANFADLRRTAAGLQRVESVHLDRLRKPSVKARVRIWTMTDFIEAPMEPLQTVLEQFGPQGQSRLSEVPRMVDLDGFGQFLQNLKNQGMHPYLMGDFPVDSTAEQHDQDKPPKPYLIR